MRYLFSSFVFLAVGLMAMSASADPGDKEGKKGDSDARAEMREKMLKEFDKDGDGKLSDDERVKAREKMRELYGDRGERGRGEAGEGPRRREDGRGPGGPEGRGGLEGRRGPGGPHPMLPRPEELFAKFDKDKDDKLSKGEFKELTEFVHEHMPPPPMPGPPGGHFEGHFEGHLEGHFGPGPDGPGRDGEGPGRRFHGPEGPPRDGEGPGRFHRPDGPPRGDGPGPGDDGPRRERRFERDGHRGPPPGDRDDGDRRPPKHDKDDDKGDKDKPEAAI